MKRSDDNISEQDIPIPKDAFQRIMDTLMDENIDPEIKARMQRYVFSRADDKKLEKAFLRYADKLKPYAGRLEGDALASYNRLAKRLGLKPVSQDGFEADRKAKPLRKARFLPVYWRVAAVLVPALIVASVWLLMNRSPYDREVRIESAEYAQQVVLPDSTHVSVEAGSSAIYRETEHSRDVELSGDAFFKVRRDEAKPFHVSAGVLELTVLGTEFDMSGNTGTVSLFRGSVSINTGNSVDTLSWGDRLTLDAATGTANISVIPSSEMIAKGYKPRLKFDRATFGEIFTALGAYHQVEIAAPGLDLQGGEFTVDFDGDTLEEALNLIVKMDKSRMTYNIEGNKVVIAKQ